MIAHYETTLAPPPLELPRNMIGAILADYSSYLVDDLNDLINDMEMDIYDLSSPVLMARRKALKDAIGVVERGNQYIKSYRFPTDEKIKIGLAHHDTPRSKAKSRVRKNAKKGN